MEEIKSKLNDLVLELDKEYRQWYRNKSKQSFRIWITLQLIAIIPGFIVSVLVAISDKELLMTYKLLIVVLTGLGSFVGFILVQPAVRLSSQSVLKSIQGFIV